MLKEELKEKKIRSNNGITLIALVITIIILLILAFISIFMLIGPNKEKSEDSENQITIAKEHVMVTANKLFSEFYEEKYIKNSDLIEDITPEEYVIKELGSKLDDKYASATGANITLKPTDPDGKVITGTYKADGTIEWSYPISSTTRITNTDNTID